MTFVTGGNVLTSDSLTGGLKKTSEEPAEKTTPPGKFKAAQQAFHNKCVRPFIYKYNVTPPEPTKWQKIKYAFSCPPHGNVRFYFSSVQ